MPTVQLRASGGQRELVTMQTTKSGDVHRQFNVAGPDQIFDQIYLRGSRVIKIKYD